MISCNDLNIASITPPFITGVVANDKSAEGLLKKQPITKIKNRSTLSELVICCVTLPLLMPGKLINVNTVKNEMATRDAYAFTAGNNNAA